MNTVRKDYKTHCKHGHERKTFKRANDGNCKACRDNKAFREANYFILPNILFTRLDYDRLYQIQQGNCAICGRHQSEFSQRLYVNHSHLTGLVRGLLCPSCNTGLGYIEKDDFGEKAKAYLLKSLQK